MIIEKNVNPLTDWDGVFKEIQNESPRSSAIIAAAFLDAQLGRVISNALINDPARVKKLFKRTLYSFSSKIETAYCMGLISEIVFHDLNIILSIRNKFAHEMHDYSFNEPEIISWCKSLKLAKMIIDVSSIPNSHDNLFLLGVVQLVTQLGLIISEEQGIDNTKAPMRIERQNGNEFLYTEKPKYDKHVHNRRKRSSSNSTNNQPNEKFRKIHRIESWAEHPEQINHKIVRAYLSLEKEKSVIVVDLQNLCADISSPYYVRTFDNNFASMKTDAGSSHGKVFRVKGGFVDIYPVVREEIRKWFGE